MDELTELLIKLAVGDKVSEENLERALFEVCDREHSTCNDGCPVYFLNDSQPVNADKPFLENRGCDCFKSGKKMLAFIRETK